MLESVESATGFEYSEWIYEGQRVVRAGDKTDLVCLTKFFHLLTI